MRARYAIALRSFESHRRATIDRAAAAVTVKPFSRRTNTRPRLRVVAEILGPVARRLLRLAALVVDRVGQRLVFALPGEAFVATAHVGVGYQRFHFQLRQLLEVVLGVVSGIGGDERAVSQNRFQRGHDRDQQLLFAARAVRLRIDDDLVLGVHGGHAGVTLYHAFARRHFRGFVVGAVALAGSPFAALAVFGVGGKPFANLCGIVMQAGDAPGFFCLEVGFDGAPVFFAMPFEHDLGGRFKFAGLTLEVGACAAL